METAPSIDKPRKAQIRPRLKHACELIVGGGHTIGGAAEIAGLSYEGLRIALHKPHVQAFLGDLKRARLGVESSRSFHRIAELRDGAQSEKVQLDAAKCIMTAAGDLEPERNRPAAAPVLVQIIAPVNAGPPLVANANGVIEAPAWPAA